MAKQKAPAFAELTKVFADEDLAREWLEAKRWPEGPVCPTTGSIFAETHIPPNKWLYAIHLMCASKKGISALQLSRTLEVTYKSGWFLAHRIRKAMEKDPVAGKLTGVVEADETYVGGKGTGTQGGPMAGGSKIAVLTLIQRDGEPGRPWSRTSRRRP